MQDLADTELLRQYIEQDSEAAFATLVTRHINLVYSVALRTTGHRAAAEEITQVVFIILARKARALRKETILSGWLYQTARLAAANFQRGEIRRVGREQEAYMQSLSSETNRSHPGAGEVGAWRQVEPLLDDAMGQLNQKERNAIVLRFFEGKSYHDVGAAFGGSENAAKKRVIHGLEKLRKIFAKQGVTSTTAIIAGVISANSLQAAPAALTKSVMAVALAKGATASISTLTLLQGALKIMAWTKMKTVAVAGVVLVLAAGTTGLVIKHERRAHQALLVAASSGESSIQSLQGRWTGSNTAHPGETCTLNISGDQVEYRGAEPNDWVRGKFVLNENTNPKEMNVTIAEPPSESGKTILIIYQSAGNNLSPAAGPHGSGQRPVDFTPGPQVDVLAFQRD